MKINSKILKNVSAHNAQLVAVTKYFSPEECLIIQEALTSYPNLWGYGENRLEDLIAKPFDRSDTHYLASLQSQKIPKLVEHVSILHSVEKISHLKKLLSYGKICPQFFLQIQLDPSKPSGIAPSDFLAFWEEVQSLAGFDDSLVLGVSGMGRGEFGLNDKIKEFEVLRNLRDEFFPSKLISAGTSRDYEIALSEGVEIVRVGRGLFEDS